MPCCQAGRASAERPKGTTLPGDKPHFDKSKLRSCRSAVSPAGRRTALPASIGEVLDHVWMVEIEVVAAG
jgi:hypothetical protein